MYLDFLSIAMDYTKSIYAEEANIQSKLSYCNVANESSTYYTIANEAVGEAIKKFFMGVLNFIRKIGSAIVNFFIKLKDRIKNAIKAFMSNEDPDEIKKSAEKAKRAAEKAKQHAEDLKKDNEKLNKKAKDLEKERDKEFLNAVDANEKRIDAERLANYYVQQIDNIRFHADEIVIDAVANVYGKSLCNIVEADTLVRAINNFINSNNINASNGYDDLAKAGIDGITKSIKANNLSGIEKFIEIADSKFDTYIKDVDQKDDKYKEFITELNLLRDSEITKDGMYSVINGKIKSSDVLFLNTNFAKCTEVDSRRAKELNDNLEQSLHDLSTLKLEDKDTAMINRARSAISGYIQLYSRYNQLKVKYAELLYRAMFKLNITYAELVKNITSGYRILNNVLKKFSGASEKILKDPEEAKKLSEDISSLYDDKEFYKYIFNKYLAKLFEF